jgi:hypothetical protein
MSDSEEEFRAVFAKKKGKKGGGGVLNAGGSEAQQAALATGMGRGDPPSLPPSRKVAAAQRAHERAVASMVALTSETRRIALSGFAALSDAETRNTRPSAASASAGGGGGSEVGITVVAAFMSAKATAGSAESTPEKRLRAWQLLFGVAELALKAPGCDEAARGEALRAQITSLTAQSELYEARGQFRTAINALEKVLDLGASMPPSAHISAHCSRCARKLAHLHCSVGSIEAARSVLFQAGQQDAAQAVPIIPLALIPASGGGGSSSGSGGGGADVHKQKQQQPTKPAAVSSASGAAPSPKAAAVTAPEVVRLPSTPAPPAAPAAPAPAAPAAPAPVAPEQPAPAPAAAGVAEPPSAQPFSPPSFAKDGSPLSLFQEAFFDAAVSSAYPFLSRFFPPSLPLNRQAAPFSPLPLRRLGRTFPPSQPSSTGLSRAMPPARRPSNSPCPSVASRCS